MEISTTKNEWITAMSISFIILLISWGACGISFETNDDTGIMMFVTGAKTGTPTAETVYCNILWGGIVSFFYKINERIPWYTGIYMVLVWGVLSVLCQSCIRIFRRDYPDDSEAMVVDQFIAGVALFCMFYFMVFGYYSVLFQFTTIAALCGFGAIMLMVLYPKGNWLSYIAFSILLFFADTIRPQSGYMVTAAFLVIAWFLYFLKGEYNRTYIELAGVMQISTYAIHALYEYTHGWSAYRLRSLHLGPWMDYPHVSFQQNPSLYESVSWSESLYNLAEKWFFMDRRVNDVEIFKQLNSALNVSSFLNWSAVKAVLYTPQLRLTFLIVGAVVICLIAFYICKRRYKRLTIVIGACIMTVASLVYFIHIGRFPYRVLFSAIILFMFPSLLLLLPNVFREIMNMRKTMIVFCVATIIIGVYSCKAAGGLMTIACEEIQYRAERIRVKKNVEQYAINHQNNIYVYDCSLALWGSPFATYAEGKPYNLTFWGGGGMFSPPYYDQLAANGLTELYSEQFFDDNIYFMAREKPDADLIAYMRDEFSDKVTTKIIAEEDGFIVYRFLK